MGLVSDKLTNMIGGVSQQAQTLRLPSQSQAELNAHLDPVDGNKKRPPIRWLKALDMGTDGHRDANTYLANRDADQRHLMVGPGSTQESRAEIRVFDLAGNLKVVNYPDRTVRIQDGALATGNGLTQIIWVPSGVTSILLVSGIAGVATIVWEFDDSALFPSPRVLRTDTVSAAGSVTITPATENGWYLRARISVWTSGAVDADVQWKDTGYLVPPPERPHSDRSHTRFTTVADHTFVLNHDKIVAKSGVTQSVIDDEAVVWVKQGAASTLYEITVDGTLRASYQTTATSTDTKTVADELFSDLDASIGTTGDGSFTLAQEGNVIYMTRVNNAAFDLAVTDGLGDRGLQMVKGKVQKFSDLPPKAPDGFRIEVVGSVEEKGDNYWLIFKDDGTGESRWEETVGPGLDNALDPSTMPHKLVYTAATDDFDYLPIAWGERVVGDADTAPDPSFVGFTINDISFFRNRLTFAADEGVISGRAGDFFEFYRESAAVLLDTDPVDIQSTEKVVAIIHHLTPWNKKLICWADGVQLIIDPGKELYTPETGSMKAFLWESIDPNTSPVAVGDRIYWASSRISGLDYVQINELLPDENRDTEAGFFDTTAHAPALISGAPADDGILASLAANSSTSMVFAVTQGVLYVYKFLFGGEFGTTRLQTAWNTWRVGLEATTTVLGAHLVGTTLYLMLVDADDNYWLGDVNLGPGQSSTFTMPWSVHLDRRTREPGVYDPVNDWTTWTLPQAADVALTYEVVLGQQWAANMVGLRLTNTTRPSTTAVRAVGDWSAFESFVGQPYVWSYTFSNIYVREGQAAQARQSGSLKLRTMEVGHAGTGYMKATVAINKRDTYTYELTPTVGVDELSPAPLFSGGFRFPIGCLNTDATITLTNDSPLPSSVFSADWEGSFSSRSRRVR